jgi:hypothetical protein
MSSQGREELTKFSAPVRPEDLGGAGTNELSSAYSVFNDVCARRNGLYGLMID